jgi:hypothetical protein
MGERWAAAVAELIALCSDLCEAQRRAAGRSRSAECDGLVMRIVMLTRLATATPWQWIPMSLLANGVYQGILRSADVAVARPDIAETHGASRARR